MWMREDFTYTDLNDIKEHLESVSFIHCLVRGLLVPIKWSIKAECLNGLGLTEPMFGSAYVLPDLSD